MNKQKLMQYLNERRKEHANSEDEGSSLLAAEIGELMAKVTMGEFD